MPPDLQALNHDNTTKDNNFLNVKAVIGLIVLNTTIKLFQ